MRGEVKDWAMHRWQQVAQGTGHSVRAAEACAKVPGTELALSWEEEEAGLPRAFLG